MRFLLHPSVWKQLTKTFFVVFFGLFSSLSATEEDDEEEHKKYIMNFCNCSRELRNWRAAVLNYNGSVSLEPFATCGYSTLILSVPNTPDQILILQRGRALYEQKLEIRKKFFPYEDIYYEKLGIDRSHFINCICDLEYREATVDVSIELMQNNTKGRDDEKNPIYIENCRNEFNEQLGILKEKLFRYFSIAHQECLARHHSLQTYYDHGFLLLKQGKFTEAMENTKIIMQLYHDCYDRLLDTDFFYQAGVSCALLNEYRQAIDALNLAIEKDPDNKNAYFERAACYFELGNTEQAIEDFIRSGAEELLQPPTEYSKIEFSKGFIEGAPEGLWEFMKDKVGMGVEAISTISRPLSSCDEDAPAVSESLIDSIKSLMRTLKSIKSADILATLAPDVVEAVHDWDTFDDRTQGRKIGHLLCKYGPDCFLGWLRGLKTWQTLRRATIATNLKSAMGKKIGKAQLVARAQESSRKVATVQRSRRQKTDQAVRLPQKKNQAGATTQAQHLPITEQSLVTKKIDAVQRNKVRYAQSKQGLSSKATLTVEELAKIEEIKKTANLKIRKGSQAKHEYGHVNHSRESGKSILDKKSNAEELVKEFAFTGIPDKHCKVPPGDPQYKEVVNFGKHIGWHVGEKGELTKTTWGKIHYSTKGAHIVPIYPRDGKKP